MKIRGLICLGATAGTVAALKLTASGGEMNDNGIYCIHEGAAINYCFVNPESTTPQEFGYDEQAGAVTQKLNDQITLSMQVQPAGEYPVLMIAPGDSPDKWSIQDNHLAVNGSTDGFYGCKDINDPYNYSKNSYAIVYFANNTNSNTTAQCAKLTISTSNSNLTTPLPDPTPSECPSSCSQPCCSEQPTCTDPPPCSEDSE
ncbi:hypothetical protein TRICI_003719 [Trichomonascus ciferrii]|uniref:DUF7907 domain-containing protein n=1 Tax=Trichomonascus ciferrii TaxID=44093 RepID=A0A642V844_9ASCO|nr:hypothetical protein TRICI_003719 [Trichomonascus ciferrii]